MDPSDPSTGTPGGAPGPAGSDSNGGARPPQHGTAELAAKERSDPNQTGGPEDGEPESGAGYGNHATGYEDEADD